MVKKLLLCFIYVSGLTLTVRAQSHCNAHFRHNFYNSNTLHFSPVHVDTGATFYWAFGDSSSSILVSPTHPFKHFGKFRVCLSVNDTVHHCSGNWCDTILMAPSSTCNASFSVYADSSMACHFLPSSHSHTTYYWTFGDSTTSTLKYPVHTFKHNGKHRTCLFTSDTILGCYSSKCDTVMSGAGSLNCYARFTFNIDSSKLLQFNPVSINNYNSYNWNFGDSITSAIKAPVHAFSHFGSFKVCFSVTDTVHHCNTSWCDSVNLSNNCTAAFSVVKDTSIYIHLTPSVTSYDNYYWTFGDSTKSSLLAAPIHSYYHSGIHTVCLTVSDTHSGCFSSHCDTTGTKPRGGVYKCNAQYAIYVNALRQLGFYPVTTSTSCNYKWSFGDSTTSSASQPVHTFPRDGKYKVCLTITDTIHKCSAIWCDSVNINSSCSANFTIKSDSIGNVHFIPLSRHYTYYKWTFGDTANSADVSPTHSFKYPGWHYACLTIADSAGGCVNTFCDSVRSRGYPAGTFLCNATFIPFDYSNKLVYFGSKSTFYYSTYNWSFGDTTTAHIKNPAHTYLHNGRFQVCLTVKDSVHKCTDRYCDSITISNACNAHFSKVVDSTGTVHFTPSVSTYNYYRWNFGDTTTSLATSPIHVYVHPGIHRPCLTVSDTVAGCATNWCDTVNTNKGGGAYACSAAFYHSINNNRNFSFHLKSSSKYLSYTWNFGDSSLSYSQNPKHIFTHDGRFYVCLTISDSTHHCNDKKCDSVKVSSSCNAGFSHAKDSTGAIYFVPAIPNYTSYNWAFGDSTYSNAKLVKHTYKHNGKYHACLIVTDTALGCFALWCDSVLTGTVSQCKSKFSVILQDTVLHKFFVIDSSTGEVGHTWLFGDSSFATADTATHYYLNGRTHNLCLAIKCTDGSYTLSCKMLTGDSVYPSGGSHGLLYSVYVGNRLPSGIQQISYPTAIHIFPNPVTGILVVNMPAIYNKSYLTIRDITGREITAKVLTNGVTELDTHNWPAGLYIMRIISLQGIYSLPVIKQ